LLNHTRSHIFHVQNCDRGVPSTREQCPNRVTLFQQIVWAVFLVAGF
jgi:hypothetical protein